MTNEQRPLDLDAIRARADAATPGPWGFNSYSAIVSPDNGFADWAARMEDGHTLERAGGCESCGDWLPPHLKRSPGMGDGCRHFDEYYDRENTVGWVPAHHGDTATGRRLADAQFIAHSREDVPVLLAEVTALRAEVARLQSGNPRAWVAAPDDNDGIDWSDHPAQEFVAGEGWKETEHFEAARAERTEPATAGVTVRNLCPRCGRGFLDMDMWPSGAVCLDCSHGSIPSQTRTPEPATGEDVEVAGLLHVIVAQRIDSYLDPSQMLHDVDTIAGDVVEAVLHALDLPALRAALARWQRAHKLLVNEYNTVAAERDQARDNLAKLWDAIGELDLNDLELSHLRESVAPES